MRLRKRDRKTKDLKVRNYKSYCVGYIIRFLLLQVLQFRHSVLFLFLIKSLYLLWSYFVKSCDIFLKYLTTENASGLSIFESSLNSKVNSYSDLLFGDFDFLLFYILLLINEQYEGLAFLRRQMPLR